MSHGALELADLNVQNYIEYKIFRTYIELDDDKHLHHRNFNDKWNGNRIISQNLKYNDNTKLPRNGSTLTTINFLETEVH